MRPRRLLLENIHSYRGRHELDLSGVGLAVLSGPNGAGKSTLASDALLYALFGEARGNADTIVSEGEQVGRVEFEFSVNGDSYVVSRQRSTKGSGKTTTAFQKLTQDGPIVLTGKSERETQEKIEQTLCMTAGLLRQTAFSTQGDAAAFAQARPADRKAVLGAILDLEAWERRAETARAMVRDAQAERDSLGREIESLEAHASEAPELQAQITELSQKREAAQTQLQEAEAEVARLQTEREDLIAKQTADVAARKELTELQGQERSAVLDAKAAADAAIKLRSRIAARPEVEQELAKATAAAAEDKRLESRRQETQQLDGEVKLAESRVEQTRTKWNSDCAALEQAVKSERVAHDQNLTALRGQIDDRQRQTEVLDTVPCAAAGNTPLVDACALIAQAREARDALPHLRRQLEGLEIAQPWAAKEMELQKLRESSPVPQLEAQRAALRADREMVAYDPKAHQQAKTAAEALPTWQKRLTQVEEAEAQLPDAEAAEKAKREAADAITKRIAELVRQLGEQTDWKQLLFVNGEKSKVAAQDVTIFRERIEQRLSDLGGLRSRLEAAQKAADRIEPLREQAGKLDRRRQLLTILGNPRDGAFSKGGIPALLIDQAIPQLQDAANDVLATLSDGRMTLELRTQRKVGKGLSETLDLVVSDDRGPRLYESFSGGERMRVDLALRVGLSEMLAARAGARCELLVLDETAAPLDARGQEQFVEAVGRVADRFGTVLVVTHLDALRDAFPTCLQVSNNGDGSRVEVLTR